MSGRQKSPIGMNNSTCQYIKVCSMIELLDEGQLVDNRLCFMGF